jgi:hypothetical protein
MDPSRVREEVSPPQVESHESDAPSPVDESDEILNLMRTFNASRRDTSISGQEENFDSELRRDPTKRLNSLVLMPNQDRETVI